MNLFILIAKTESSPLYFTKLIIPILMIAGLLKCVKIAKREKTSTLCVYSLALVTIAFLILQINIILKNLIVNDKFVYLVFLIIIFCVSTMLNTAGVVIGLIGLLTYKKKKFNQGIKQAIWGIIFGIIFYMCVVGGVLSVYMKGKKDQPVFGNTSLSDTRGVYQKTFVHKEHNFKVNIKKGWARKNYKKIQPVATFSMINSQNEIHFMIISENAGIDNLADSEQLKEISKNNLLGGAPRAKITDQPPLTVNGLKGLRFDAEATISKINLNYAYWVLVKNGYLYQLIAFTDAKNKKALSKEAENAFKQFDIIDENQIAMPEGSKPFTQYTSKKFGYSLSLPENEWITWSKNDFTNNSEVDFGLTNIKAKNVFFVTPFKLDGEINHLDAVTQALIKNSLSTTYPGKGFSDQKEISENGMKGYLMKYQFTDDDNDEIHYLLKILQGENVAYLIVMGITSKNKDEINSLEALALNTFSKVKFFPLDKTAKLTEKEKENQAAHFNSLGLFYYNSEQYSIGNIYFMKASTLNPANLLFFTNRISTINMLKQYKEGLKVIESNDLKKETSVKAWRGWFLNNLNMHKDAVTEYEEVFKADHRDKDDFKAYLASLANLEKWDAIDKEIAKYNSKKPDISFRIKQAQLLKSAGKYQKALDVLIKYSKNKPLNTALSYEKIYCYNNLNEYKNSLKEAEYLITKGYASAYVYYLKGDAEYELKWYRKAKISMEKAVSKNPNDIDYKEYLQDISSMLGEGDNSTIKDKIPPVPLPENLKKKIENLPTDFDQNKYNTFYYYIIEGIEYTPKKERRKTRSWKAKVLTSAAVSDFSTLSIDFNPEYEKLYVNELVVYDGNDEVVSRGNPKDYYLIDKQKNEYADNGQTLNIPVPGLMPGYSVALKYTVKQRGQPARFDWYTCALVGFKPVLIYASYVLTDTKNIKYKSSRIDNIVELPNGKLWFVKNPPVFKSERCSVMMERYLPYLWIGNSNSNWKKCGLDYWNKIKVKFEDSSDKVKCISENLVNKEDTDKEKISKITEYIQKNFTYKPIEFGVRGQIPNNSEITLNNKYGDCKDFSLLLVKMLEAVGIQAFPALVNTNEIIIEEIPTDEQFNHVIVYIPGVDKGLFIDPTNVNYNFEYQPPPGLALKKALIMDIQNIRINEIPDYKEDQNWMNIKRKITIDQNEVSVVSDILVDGYFGFSLKGYLKNLEEPQRIKWFEGILNHNFVDFKINNVITSGLEDNKKPLTFRIKYSYRFEDIKHNGQAFHFSPNPWIEYYLLYSNIEDRSLPFRTWIPFELKNETELISKNNLPLSFMGKDSGDTTKYIDWNIQLSNSKNSLKMKFKYKSKKGIFPADKYEDFCRISANAVRASRQSFVISKKKSKD